MNKKEYTYYYFLGIGGIGMSALARYFNFKGGQVYGYDKTSTVLTKNLEKEGIEIHYNDSISNIPQAILDNKEKTLVIYTPAIPQNHTEYNLLLAEGFTIVKRAKALGTICDNQKGIAISGTHGKTSVTTFTTHILYNSQVGCSAFLGGISKNFKTNFVFNGQSENVVVEADEYDRSFHSLYPHTALITSIDADHLDIYGSYENIVASFFQFVSQITDNGNLIYKSKLDVSEILPSLKNRGIKVYTYSLDDTNADFYASKIERKNNAYNITIHTPFGIIENVVFHLPGKVNIENLIAASSIALCNGVSIDELVKAIATLQGVERRLDTHVSNDNVIYIDDYAHHPEELRACISSIKELYFDKKITGIFQPHLYSRTQDFAKEFGESLSLLDEVILLEIYPAREEPIAGVSSQLIFDSIHSTQKTLCNKADLMELLAKKDIEVLLTMGAGDIDRYIKPIIELVTKNV